jgi:hypothetical protein
VLATEDFNLGLLYNVSNGGGTFDVTLVFDDGSITVTLAAPDWLFVQPVDAPNPGVATQARLDGPIFSVLWDGVETRDLARSGPALSLVEATISASSLLTGLGFDVTGRSLISIEFDNLTGSDLGDRQGALGIYAASVNGPDGSVGGSVAGINARFAGCINLTASQEAFAPLPDLRAIESWNCDDLGVTSTTGDTVRLIVGGAGVGTSFLGQARGLEVLDVLCRNETHGVGVKPPVSDQGVWDCFSAGLPIAPGDVVRAIVTGTIGQTFDVKLRASDGASGDQFGVRVALDGNSLIVGAWKDDDLGPDSGAAYIFENDGSGWSEVAKLLASDGSSGDSFGGAVTISGGVAVVGARDDDNASGFEAGAAYVFERSGGVWTPTAVLRASDGDADDEFGVSVAMGGGTILVGAYQFDVGPGAAYVFEKVDGEWLETAKLEPPDGALDDLFAWDVAIDEMGETIVIGSRRDDDNGIDSGSAYVYEKVAGVWASTAKLLASDGSPGDEFGRGVFTNGDVVLVGAIQVLNFGSGAAYVFEKVAGAWTEMARLDASDGAVDDEFGTDLAVSGDTVLVGAPRDDDNGLDSGSVYVFQREGTAWAETAKIVAPDGAAGDNFGDQIFLQGNLAVFSARLDNTTGGVDAGSAYVCSLAPAELPAGGRVTGTRRDNAVCTNLTDGESREFTSGRTRVNDQEANGPIVGSGDSLQVTTRGPAN